MPGKIGLALRRLGLGSMILTAAACGAAGSRLTPSAATTTVMAGWERWFKLDWTVEAESNNTRRIRGYVSSQHGQRIEPLRILALALDASGAMVGERIGWVPGGVGGRGRAFFEITRLPAAAEYRVTVWDYSIQESAGELR
jgi:hypothetical protein